MPRGDRDNWGGARSNRSPAARPVVKRVILTDEIAAELHRRGYVGKERVQQHVNRVLLEWLALTSPAAAVAVGSDEEQGEQ